MRELIAEPIEQAAFEPYGQTLSTPVSGNRTDYAAQLSNGRPGVDINLAVVRANPPKTLPIDVVKMERHPLSSQAFMPLDCDRYLVIVANPQNMDGEADGPPDLSTLRAFTVPGDVGINYNAGTWHFPLTSLDRAATFALLMYMDGGPGDEDWATLPEPIQLAVD
ncbi:MAG: ureidoglycolate hydrolase [Rhodospirillaceae bacterium]|jgi:ureidoglycolate hydrolase|nr:ureidoglycolate hydrolase [Rhodospirillaceae bacterium]MBT4043691.1 ureidoglycolate hydrolase [Rhodospirillaceae bacterium]MBT4686964.1 ureidoglycolate hydrolase [Rhodospirillaceae bacterium]MBT5081790.1 ureidoglycolate hydrolase [Rhodospirillaceae bacterium]MBT5525478.1 ureidoglycolate hydrolase [Rhodospirillaceae bacterium]